MQRALVVFLSILVMVGLWAPVRAKVSMPPFDLEAHRGGRNLRPENTLAAFRNAIEMGVTTLEMDVQLTRDLVPVLSHNGRLSHTLTRDSKGKWLVPGAEPVFHDLSLAQVKTYEVGGINPADKEYFDDHGKAQQVVPGERIPTLEEVFELADRLGNRTVRFNIETKSYATEPSLGIDPYTFTAILLGVIKKHHMEGRCMIQSFDWRTLIEVRRMDKDMTIVALTSEVPEWGEEGWYRHVGEPGASPWMAGLDIDDFGGDYVKAAKQINADVVSPYYKELTRALVEEAHALGMKVVPWTVNATPEMARMIDMGVDGLISDRPDLLKQVLVARKMRF